MRDWRTFLELVEQLPQGSHYWASVIDDDDIAQYAMEHQDHDVAHRPGLREWDPIREQLAVIENRLIQLVAVGSQGQVGLDPAPYPETARERLGKTRLNAKRDHILSQLVGTRYDDGG